MKLRRPPHANPLPQARLGELATLGGRIRERMRLGEGSAAALALREQTIRAFPLRLEGQGDGGLATPVSS